MYQKKLDECNARNKKILKTRELGKEIEMFLGIEKSYHNNEENSDFRIYQYKKSYVLDMEIDTDQEIKLELRLLDSKDNHVMMSILELVRNHLDQSEE
jgi:adenylylsulfate kinase-like enzyme